MPVLKPTKKLQVLLGAAHTTNALHCVASFRDITTGPTYDPDQAEVETNGTTAVDWVAAPGAGVKRVLTNLQVRNRDTVPHTVTIRVDVSGTAREFCKIAIGVDELLAWSQDSGWTVQTSAGLIKTQYTQASPLAGQWNVVTLSADVTYDGLVANELLDLTGLSFPVDAGTYWFRARIFYTVPATTTGTRFSMNGPAASTPIFMSEYSLAATTTTRNANNISYNLPAAANATSGSTAANMARLEGGLLVTGSGTASVRWASEVLASNPVAKKGSMLEWLKTA